MSTNFETLSNKEQIEKLQEVYINLRKDYNALRNDYDDIKKEFKRELKKEISGIRVEIGNVLCFILILLFITATIGAVGYKILNDKEHAKITFSYEIANENIIPHDHFDFWKCLHFDRIQTCLELSGIKEEFIVNKEQLYKDIKSAQCYYLQ